MKPIEESLKKIALDMLDIILEDDSTSTEKINARYTLFEIISPNLIWMKKPPSTCGDCFSNMYTYTWMENEQCFKMVCPSCGEEYWV